jgi:type IV pilus assembly protein PilW
LKYAARANRSVIMHQHKGTGGFSLVELLISMIVGLLILSAVNAAFTVHNRHFKKQELNVEMLQNARVGLDFIIRELRTAGYNPTGALNPCIGTNTATNSPCIGITSAAVDSISFTADLNGNGSLTPDDTNPDENITYNIYNSGGVTYLGRTSNGSIQQVSMNLSALSFSYYDGSNQNTTNLALIRKVRVSITTRSYTPGSNDAGQTTTLSSDIVPKCLDH